MDESELVVHGIRAMFEPHSAVVSVVPYRTAGPAPLCDLTLYDPSAHRRTTSARVPALPDPHGRLRLGLQPRGRVDRDVARCRGLRQQVAAHPAPDLEPPADRRRPCRRRRLGRPRRGHQAPRRQVAADPPRDRGALDDRLRPGQPRDRRADQPQHQLGEVLHPRRLRQDRGDVALAGGPLGDPARAADVQRRRRHPSPGRRPSRRAYDPVRLLPLLRGVRARPAPRAGAAGRARGVRRAVDQRPLPPVDRRPGPVALRVVDDRRDLSGVRPAGHDRGHLPDRAHPPGDRRAGRRHRRRCCSARAASRSASAPARPSTSTCSATAGRAPTSGSRCWRRPSRSSAGSGPARSSPTRARTTRSTPRGSTRCPTPRRRST